MDRNGKAVARMLSHTSRAQTFCDGKSYDDFCTNGIALADYLGDEILQESVMYCLGQMGEIASKIPDEEQEKYPSVFWRQMVGLRHRLFHDYEAINFSKVYDITRQPINDLARELEIILANIAFPCLTCHLRAETTNAPTAFWRSLRAYVKRKCYSQ